MDLQRKIDIEPLSEGRRARIEESLFDRLARTRWMPDEEASEGAASLRWRPAMGLVLAGALAAVVGGVAVRTVLAPHGVGEAPAPQASHIQAGPAGSHLGVGESSLDLAPGSEADVVGDDAHGILVLLERGSVECEVAPRHGRPAFVVRAGDTTVKVVGTHFRVTLTGRAAEVYVQHGTVETSGPFGWHVLHDGERWPLATDPSPRELPPPFLPDDSTATRSANPPPAAPSSPSPSVTPEAQYNRAASIEARRPAEALALYRELARGSGAWAENALFAEGRLEADRGHDAEARRLLSEYLTRYAQGPNAADARGLLDRLH